MNNTGRNVIFVGLLVAFAVGGAYAWAWLSNTDRIAAFVSAVDEIGYARGGRVPTEAAFRAEVEGLATVHELTFESLEITGSERTGTDAVGRLANERLAPVGGVSMRMYEYRVVATVVARKWVFPTTREVEITRSFRTQVTLTPRTGGARPPASSPSRPLPPVKSQGSRGL